MKKILLSIFSLYIMVALSSCGGQEKTISTDIVDNPKSANSSNSEDAPKIEFENSLHDFGNTMQGERLSYAFKFTNAGKKDLIISQASASCGCTVADFPQNPIAPGKEGYITVVFDTKGLKGYQSKSVTVFANTIPNQISLRITAMVEIP